MAIRVFGWEWYDERVTNQWTQAIVQLSPEPTDFADPAGPQVESTYDVDIVTFDEES